MNHTQLLRAILPDVLIDNFDVAKFEKTELCFDIWLEEKKVQMREDKGNSAVISHGFGEYHTIQDFPIRGRATYLHVRKRKWLDKDTGEIFSYDWELSNRQELPSFSGCSPDLEEAYNIYLELVDIFNKRSKPAEARLNLARWYNKVEAFGDDGFSKVIETFENHNATIINYFEDRLTNASAESFNAKIKAFRTQFRGGGDIKFFMFRLATLYS